MWEAGLPRYFAGALGAAEEFHQAAALASAPLGQVLPSVRPRLSFTRRRPAGVVGVIAPFNAPLMLAARAIAPALAVGNAVVLKPDPRTAVCGGIAFARLLEQAGLPRGTSSTSCPGGADIGRELVTHPGCSCDCIHRLGDCRQGSGATSSRFCSSGCTLSWVGTPHWWCSRMPTFSRRFAGSFGSFHNAGRCAWPQAVTLSRPPLSRSTRRYSPNEQRSFALETPPRTMSPTDR